MNRLPRPDAFAAILRPLRLMIPAGLLLLLATACKDDPQVHLTGDIKGLQQPEILAYGFRPDTCRLLSLPQHGGDFQADFLPDSLQPFVLILDGKTEIPLFAEGGDEVRVTGDVRHPEEITVTGGRDENGAEITQNLGNLNPQFRFRVYGTELKTDELYTYIYKLIRESYIINSSLFISNIITSIENNFANVKSVKYLGVDNFDASYQEFTYNQPDFTSVDIITRYIPEQFNVTDIVIEIDET